MSDETDPLEELSPFYELTGDEAKLLAELAADGDDAEIARLIESDGLNPRLKPYLMEILETREQMRRSAGEEGAL